MATIKKTAFLWTLAAISLGFTACGSDDKSDDNSGAKAECDFTAPRCNADGTKLETCTDGKLTVKECSCKDGKCEETADKECDFTAPRCNADGTKLETCTDGKLTVKECNCKDGKCEETADKDCDFTAPRCNADGTKLETCTDGKLTVRECSCKNGKCEGCNYEGTICDDKKQNVMSCDKDTGTEKPVEQCLYGCEDGKCLAEKCPSPDAKACVDMKTRRYCDTATGTMVEKKCEGDLICSDGDCQERDAEVSCDFEKRCTEDGRGIQDCVDGKIEYTQCKSGETCTTEGGIQCVKIETCENFKPYCGKNDDGSEYAVVCPVDAKPTDKPFVKKCGAVCRNGECVGKLEFGSPCDPGENGSWRDTCIGNKIARCIKRSDGGYEITEPKDERCEEKGMICGMERTDLEEFQDPHCYDPCTTIGQVVGSCVPNGAGTASLVSRAVSAIVILSLLFFKPYDLQIRRLFAGGFRPQMIRRILGVGIPAGVEGGLFQAGKLTVQRFVTLFGTAAIAANAVANTMATIANCKVATYQMFDGDAFHLDSFKEVCSDIMKKQGKVLEIIKISIPLQPFRGHFSNGCEFSPEAGIPWKRANTRVAKWGRL